MKNTLLFLLLLVNGYLCSQNKVDSLLEALPDAKDTLRLQAIDEILTIVRGTDKELAQRLINEEYELAALINDERFTAGVHNSNAIFKYFQSDLDSAIFYFEKSLNSFQKIGANEKVASLNNNIGILYETKGDYEKSIQSHLASLRIKEELGNKKGVAISKFNIGNLWTELGNYKLAKESYNEAYNIYQDLALPDDLNDVLFNLASIASKEDSSQLALSYYKQSLAHFEKIGDENGSMSALANIGQEYSNKNNLDSALYFFDLSLPLAKEFEDIEQEASLSRSIGDVYSKQGDHSRAIPLLKRSVELFTSIDYKDQLADSYQYLYEAQENAGQFEEAYNNLHNYAILRDSIASKKMQTDLIELQTKYETEKKEKQLILTKAENDKKQSRIILLTSGLCALLLLLMTGYLAMREKIKRNRLEKEKVDLELSQAEQQLEYKKKELIAKVLQLSKKNEFLNRLEQEVTDLKTSIGSSISKSTDRIDRMITNDSLDEEEWDQFSKEFSSVHEGFIQKITQTFGTFSQSEMRLISLLKMNLTSKEIANILRISDEGIKKARYRLRKKMGLETGDDLQGVILTL